MGGLQWVLCVAFLVLVGGCPQTRSARSDQTVVEHVRDDSDIDSANDNDSENTQANGAPTAPDPNAATDAQTEPCMVGARRTCFAGEDANEGIGVCTRGMQICTLFGEFAIWGACEGYGRPEDETCDGADNDCDGTIDEGCECDDEQTRSCYDGPQDTQGRGLCEPGIQRCVDHKWSACDDAVTPDEERCDGEDNDCDGEIDEGCNCREGDTRTCYTGVPSTQNVGICHPGTQRCVNNGWGACEGEQTPLPEECDELDNDCDAEVDETCVDDICRAVDLTVLMDVTGSMSGSIAALQATLTARDGILERLDAVIPQLRLGVAAFRDVPVSPYGSASDLPFMLEQSITSDAGLAQSAVNRLSANGGGDTPESAVESLYQAVTNEGLSGLVPPAACSDGYGQMCLSVDATPVFLVITDAPTHNGPPGVVYPYTGLSDMHDYAQTLDQLNDVGAYVLGVAVGPATATHQWLAAIASDTDALDAAGEPIVFSAAANGTGLTDAVVDAVHALCLASSS